MAKIVLTVDGAILKELQLYKSRVAIGRRASNDLVINHVAVSGLHAAIVVQQGKFFVEDLNSTNGTQLNGLAIIERCLLKDNDVIEITPYQIRFLAETLLQTTPAEGSGVVVKVEMDELAEEIESLDSNTQLQQFALLRVLDGPSVGKELSLTKPMTTFGRPGVQVAVLTQRKQAYFISHVEGKETPLINGMPIGQLARKLEYDDVIDLSGTRIVFCRDE